MEVMALQECYIFEADYDNNKHVSDVCIFLTYFLI